MNINVDRIFKSSSQANIKIPDIERIVEKAFGTPADILSIDISKYGDVNSCYVLTIKNPDKKLFLKVENHDLIPQFYSGQIERENAGIELLKFHGIQCPSVVSCDLTKSEIGKKYILTDFIEGQLLNDVWSTLSLSEKSKAKDEITELINKLENLESPYFGDLYENGNRGRFKYWKDAFLNLSEILLNDCANAVLLDDTELRTIKAAINKAYSSIGNNHKPCFNHMDIHAHNIIVNRQENGIKINALIDFGNSMFGIPNTDEYRLSMYKFFREEPGATKKFRENPLNNDEIFSCNILFALECLVFEGMMKSSKDRKLKVLSQCEAYLAS